MHSIFKTKILQNITLHEATRVKRRPRRLDEAEAIDCLFKLVRTGMQWNEVRATTASYTSVFKHTRRWIQAGVIEDSYASVLQGRKALKVSILTDHNGVVHNLRADTANTSDFNLFAPMLSSMLIQLRRIHCAYTATPFSPRCDIKMVLIAEAGPRDRARCAHANRLELSH